jgi:hypothetical protein
MATEALPTPFTDGQVRFLAGHITGSRDGTGAFAGVGKIGKPGNNEGDDRNKEHIVPLEAKSHHFSPQKQVRVLEGGLAGRGFSPGETLCAVIQKSAVLSKAAWQRPRRGGGFPVGGRWKPPG